ncbi:MAG: Clp protease N-terminal domain-containing protein [Dehalococcoidia bacterium]
MTLQVGKPLSRGLAEALDRAAGEADRLGHRRAQPAHVLLALIEREGALRRALRAGGGETKAVRAALRDHAAGRDRLTRELDAVQGARDAAEEAGGEDARKALHDRECNLIERLQRLDKG